MKNKLVLLLIIWVISVLSLNFVIASEKVFVKKIQEEGNPKVEPELVAVDDLNDWKFHNFEHKLIYGNAYKEDAIYYSTYSPYFISNINYSEPVEFGTFRDNTSFGYFLGWSPNMYTGQIYLSCSPSFSNIVNSNIPVVTDCWFQFYDTNNIAHYTKLNGYTNYWKFGEVNYIYLEGFGKFLKENGEEKKLRFIILTSITKLME